jgi:hypothetical protein
MSYDARLIPPDKRESQLSPLMQWKNAGGVPNLCPYGCPDEDLNEHGYCYHLIGFANCDQMGGKPKVGARVERMTVVKGKNQDYVQVHVPFKKVQVGPGKIKRVYDYDRIQKSDILHQISTSYRVYRNIPRPDYLPREEIQVADDEPEEELIEDEQ